MGFNITLLMAITLPQIIIVTYFNRKNIRATGKNKGSYNTANAAHALVFAIFTTLFCPSILFEQYSLGGVNTYETDIVLHVAISFFLTHMIPILASKRMGSEFIHHIVCLSTLFYSLITQTFGQDLVLTIFLGELPFVFYITIIAKNFNNKLIENICEDILVFMLIPLRFIIYPTYLYLFVTSPTAVLLPSLLALCFLLQGFYFANAIFKKWRKRRFPS